MSRYTFESASGDRLVQFGHDRVMGYYITVFDEVGDAILREDSWGDGLTARGLMEQLDEFEPPEELEEERSGSEFYWLDLRLQLELDLPV